MAGDVSDEDRAWQDLIARITAPAPTDGSTPWPDRESLPARPGPPDQPRPAPAGAAPAEPGAPRPPGDVTAQPDPGPPVPPQARVVRPAGPPPADDDGADHFVPPPPPPLPRLDPVSKGAWAALFGGPGYLLLAVMLSWQIPGWAAFCAVAAFVAGFAVLVIRLGDGPPRDSGPDNGAVL